MPAMNSPMPAPQPITRYSAPAVALHWLVALFMLCAFALGLYMTDLPLSPQKLQYYSWHKWLGVSVFLLACVRLFWRLTHVAPPLPASTPAWQGRVSAIVHASLYLTMFALPLSGWLYSSASGYQTVYLGVLPLPDLLAKDKALAAQLKDVHELLGEYLLVALVLAHAGAAIKHQFIDRDGLMRRMWFR